MRRTGIESSFLCICFVLQFHSAFASPTDRWQLFDNVGTAGFPGQSNIKGYECGNDFFSDSDIKEALSIYHHQIDQNRYTPLANQAPPVNPDIHLHRYNANDPQEIESFDVDQYLNLEEFDTPIESNSPRGYQDAQQHLTPIIYQGPLYSDSWSSNYILWPIQKRETISSPTKYLSEPYYIVINKQNGEVIDVLSRIKNNDLTKCIRMDGSRTKSSAVAPHMNNGYQCGHEFLSDELIQKSLHLIVNDQGILNAYPTLYYGRLYPANNGYMIWPIFSRDGLYNYKSVEAGPYFLVIDWKGSLIGIVVEGLSGNFLRCPRSRKFSTTPPTNVPNHSSKSVPASLTGYQCGRVKFNDKTISEAVRMAKDTARTRPSSKLPAKYKGPPFDELVLLWPLLSNGLVYKRGAQGLYRVVLTQKLEFIGVGIIKKGIFHLCEKGMMEEEKIHEKSDYYCFDHLVTNHDLEKAANLGCQSFIKRKYKSYPAEYEGPKFDRSGPYFTYPVLQGAEFTRFPGRDRVVINSKCEIVGAITFILKKKARDRGSRFVLCIKDEEFLTKPFKEPDMPIIEHRRKLK